MEAPARTALVLYGSETGNAQDMGEETARMCQRLHFQTSVEELDGIELSALLQHDIVLIIISTTGQGDMPHNSTLFWRKLLRKKLPAGCLADMDYACLGLGDSTYLKFNWAARKLARRLDQLGAAPVIEATEADEQFPDGIEGIFATWLEKIRNYLAGQFPLPDGLQAIPEDQILPPVFSLASALAKHGVQCTDEPPAPPEQSVQKYDGPDIPNLPPQELLSVPNSWRAELSDIQRLTPTTHGQDVRLLTFEIPSRGNDRLHINPGDCLTLYPKNFPQDVQRLISLMHWEAVADLPLDLDVCPSLPKTLHTPPQTTRTLRDLLLTQVDFTAVPRRSFLKSMSFFAADPEQKERLLEFTHRDYLDEYFDYATRSRRSILEVLDEFTSVRIPAHRLLDVFPPIRGRDFSVANGGASQVVPASTPGAGLTRVQLLVAMVKYRTILRRPRQGLCSRYIASLERGAQLCVTHKPVLSPIHGSKNAQRPLVAMATGTGVAPVRSLIHERLTHATNDTANPGVGPMHLFFGNRNRDADYFFEHEWSSLGPRLASEEIQGQLQPGSEQEQAAERTTAAVLDHTEPTTATVKQPTLQVWPAFSRDTAGKKVYVQHVLAQNRALLESLIHRDAIFVVCGGSTRMADACKEAVFDGFLDGAATEDDRETRKQVLEGLTWWQEIW